MMNRFLVAAAAGLTLALSAFAVAQTMPAAPDHPGAGGMAPMAPHKMGMTAGHGHAGAMAMPTLAGQDAFGAVQEIVRLLEADPRTDWSKVNLSALREHLIDMNEVTLKADAAEQPVDGGLAIRVTGDGRTRQAIARMIPAHAHEIDGLHGWTVRSEPLADGALLTVTASDPKEVAHIRGLGFIGILASGSHHQRHHLAIATGARHLE